ncbi:hypothetical protein A7985_18000 [Pseudoalteromonas luteoviolacea]|uniref:Uncharacterized protein n=1 Tax=Pseudoalteromonas luteoviolacea TaxID=43657 RepID=A0A1C0TN34_9GAMM|nr:hypothetical protein [Pseudoalteromonas luteoviolacea]MBQ4812194.1 hypothetical protein [Pseudoalteromonas luteoviolacea]OCQ20315.1 hypothetical protein A7985_18000 [Pseudoalteromonas luteoviolacea]
MLLKKTKFMQIFGSRNTSIIGNMVSSVGVENQKRNDQKKNFRGLSNCQIMMVEGGIAIGGGAEPPMAIQCQK